MAITEWIAHKDWHFDKVRHVEFCPCGLVEGHTERCLSIRAEHKDKIGPYSGFSKNYDGFQKGIR